MTRLLRTFLVVFTLLGSTFSSFAQFQINNDASSMGGSIYQLTPDDFNKYGSVWYKLQHDLNDPLNIQGQFYFGTDPVGADGIAFVLQNNCLTAGTGGGGIGYGGIPGQSLAIEFDTYQNTPSTGGFDNHDPLFDHIAVMSNGIVDHGTANNLFGPVQASSTVTNIKDGAWHDFRVNYDPASKLLTVYFDGVLRVSYTYDIKANIFLNNPYVYWGFTSSTGGFKNEHRVNIDANLSTITLPNSTTCNTPVTVDLPPLTRYYGLNQALNRTATMSSSEYGPTNAQEAFDGNMNSRWSSQFSDPQWIYVDLGTNYDLDSVVLYWEGAYGSQYQIQVSNNASAWTTVYTETAGDGGKDKIIFNSNSRYVRMYGTTRATGYGYSLWEFQVYGKPNYVWSPNDGSIDNIYSANPTFTPSVTTTYTVLIPDPCSVVVSYNMTITVDCGSLPVSLISFTGKHLNKVNHLTWTTSLEINTSYFNVMRSADGIHFTSIGTVPAAHNSQTIQNYALDDTNPLEGVSYYKLVAVDLDGTTSVSKIITLEANDEPGLYITAPVFNTNTSLILPGYNDWVSLTVVDVQGRVVLEDYRTSTDGIITFGDALPSNTSFYLAIVQTALERKVFKIIKTD